jgi:elongation factor P--(R)-beta-lysine ligase
VNTRTASVNNYSVAAMTHWKPAATIEVLRRRDDLLSRIRRFFSERGILEVETPLLASSTATDLYIQSLAVSMTEGQVYYLQTSPEFAMKRLLAAGSGPIYQISKAFRQDERSLQHNPEFTLLEWYRPGFSMQQLMDEVEQLLLSVLGGERLARFSYRDLFQQELGIDPHQLSADELRQFAQRHINIKATDLSATDYLQLLMNQCIEPALPVRCFVYDYPVAQAALARIETDASGQAVARRFELYVNGMELANGFFELTDAAEQRARFEADLRERARLGLPLYPIDENLLAALAAGIPDCAGVAVGIDRLLMAAENISDIREVLVFPTDQA